jgi:hypothetical protein
MENKLDKLFRDKLEQHSIAPSAFAWEKVAAGFPKKNNTWALSWRIAAAVALLAVAGWFAFDFRETETKVITKDTTTQQQKQEVVASEKKETEKPLTEKKTPAPVQRPVARPIVKEAAPALAVTQPTKENEIENIQPEQTIASVEEVTEPVAIQEQVTQPKATKPMVIVYTLAAVEPKQEVETAKASTFKKVIEFAKDVKGGESTTLASVRNWKDNLFGSEEQTRVEKQNN